MDFVVPFAMIRIAFDIALSQLLITYFPALLVGALVDPRMDFQSRFCGRRADRFNHDFQGLQRRPLPVPRNVAEHPMLDLVPLARSRRILADPDAQPRLAGPFLPLPFPPPSPRTVSA